jgi:hypothetical protein
MCAPTAAPSRIGGSITLTFAGTAVGAIPCPANSLTTIFRAIPGWDSINNPTDGVLGSEVESRAQFEARRKQSVAKNARGSVSSILGAVLDVGGVLDAYVNENATASPTVIRGVTVAAKSIIVTASGGTDLDVATAVWTKKAPGCGYTGNTPVTVLDSNSGYSPPLPSYTVTIQRPSSLAILFAVNIVNSLQVPSDGTLQIQNAIIAAFAGADGGTRARIASAIYASRYFAPIGALGTWAQIVSCLVGSNNTSGAKFTASIAGLTMTVTATASGAVAIGQTISDALGAVPAGTKIVSGSAPTWTLNNSLTVSSRAMTGAVPTQTVVDVNADQVPTINANNITVALV